MKIPPHNLDAEQSVLGACMISAEAAAQAAELLTPADFHHGAHAEIFAAICQLTSQGAPVDYISVTDELQRRGSLKRVGGASALVALANATPEAASVRHHARIVAGLAERRRIIEACQRIAAKGYEAEDADEYRAEAETELFRALDARKRGGDLTPVGDIILGGVLQEITSREPQSGPKSPWADLNDVIPFFAPGDLYIVAGRPAMGKTSFAEQLGYHVAKNYGPVAFFSLEMSRAQLVTRIISRESSVSSHFIRTRTLEAGDIELITQTARGIVNRKVPLFIDDTGAATVAQIRSKSQRVKLRRGLAMVVVDYVQLMGASKRAQSREQEIAEISRGLKGLAKELNVPVVALAQLSRKVEERAVKRPVLSDLRESGALEQDADAVIFLYRHEYYHPGDRVGEAEFIVAKQRNGPIGDVKVCWQPQFTRFVNLTRRKGGAA